VKKLTNLDEFVGKEEFVRKEGVRIKEQRKS